MGCLKNYVMREPLVDTVDKRQICTDHYPLKVKTFIYQKKSSPLFLLHQTFDLKTMSIDDINVDTKFRLRALRDDYIHAFVTYFLVEFTACPQRTVISTGRNINFEIKIRLRISFSSTWCWLYTLETNCFLFS
jgi:protein arginine N-methyltransferase 1